MTPFEDWVATDHQTFDQGALSPLGWPYCCLCFRPLNVADCWRDDQGAAWDVCRLCKLAEALSEIDWLGAV